MLETLNQKSKLRYVLGKFLVLVIIFIISVFIQGFFLGVIEGFFGHDYTSTNPSNQKFNLIFSLYSQIIFIIITCVYVKYFEKRSIKTIGLNKKRVDYGHGLTIGIILITISVLLATLFKGIKYEGISSNIDYLSILLFLGGYIIQGANEEILIRGFLMTSLMKKVSLKSSVIITSILFTVLHFSSLLAAKPIYVLLGSINLFLISIIFSLLIIKRKNIWSACAAHSIWNFLLYNVYGLTVSGISSMNFSIFKFTTSKDSILNGSIFGLEASILTSLVLIVAIIIMVKKYENISIEPLELDI